MAFPSHGITHRSTVTGTRGMIASAHPLASLAGARILLQGGNAFDAAIAVASTLNVVEPYMSGIAGNGYMVLYSAKEQAIRVLDYVGTSPYGASRGAFPTPDVMEVGIRSGMVFPGHAGAGWLHLIGTAVWTGRKSLPPQLNSRKMATQSRSRMPILWEK